MKVRQQAERWRDELARYFAGLDGAMGLRSWLGRWEDHGPTRGGTSMATPPEHDGAALEAARVARRVEDALRAIGRRRARVLAALHAPRPPHGLDVIELRGIGWVALEAEEAVARVLAESDAEPKAAGVVSAPLSHLALPDRLRLLAAAHGSPERRLLRRVAVAVRAETGAAHQAFEEAWQVAVRAQRDARHARLRAALEARP